VVTKRVRAKNVPDNSPRLEAKDKKGEKKARSLDPVREKGKREKIKTGRHLPPPSLPVEIGQPRVFLGPEVGKEKK